MWEEPRVWRQRLVHRLGLADQLLAGEPIAVPEPRLDFIRWLAENRPVVFHGSPRDDLRELSTERQSRDATAWGDRTPDRSRLRAFLLVGEVSLTTLLLVGALLLMQSLLNLQRVPLGIDAESVLTAKLALTRARLPNGTEVTAAVLHLARIGIGDDQPWEVVGSEDTTLTLTRPAYGAAISSPVTVGGRITGVDESLRVAVLALGGSNPLGEIRGMAAGGQNAPWSATVSFRRSGGTVRTIVVSTASHLDRGVDRFAITGVRVG